MSIPFYNPSPAPEGVFAGQPLPESHANLLSRFFFQWVTPILQVGYSRPLQAGDLWEIPYKYQSRHVADTMQLHWQARLPPSQRLADYRPSPQGEDPTQSRSPFSYIFQPLLVLCRVIPFMTGRTKKKIQTGEWISEGGKIYDLSFPKAILWTILRHLTMPVIFGILGNLLIVSSPLVSKVLIKQLTLSHDDHETMMPGHQHTEADPPGKTGYSIGLSIALSLMLFIGGMLKSRSLQAAQLNGALVRSATIDLISRKSMRLSGKARLEMTDGRINNLVSADSGQVEWSVWQGVALVQGPMTIVAGVALLIKLLGRFAVVGLAVLSITAPVQGWLFRRLLNLRTAQNKIIDQRIGWLTQIIGNIRAVKLYSYEEMFADKILTYRERELATVHQYSLVRTSVDSMFSYIPILAAVSTFVAYRLAGHALVAETIFPALQLFNIVRSPLQAMPMQFGNFTDSLAAMRRMEAMLKADELREKIDIDERQEVAINVTGDFTFEDAKGQKNGDQKPPVDGVSEVTTMDEEVKRPFALRNIDLKIPKGALVCVVGRVGTGKSALLLGLINEMRQTQGQVTFGGNVSYVPQQAWVQSGSVRDNIVFSQPEKPDLARVNEVMEACALRADLENWRDGDLTLVGERGITLSGGQRQRICIARAAYEETTVVLLDDPLSAVDAHVGHHLVEQCLLSGRLADRTRILVTHQLDILPRADLVLVMDRDHHNEGRIAQQGTYQELLSQQGIFQTLMQEFGSVKDQSSGSCEKEAAVEGGEVANKQTVSGAENTKKQTNEAGAGLGHSILEEERFTGAVSWNVYARYLSTVKSWPVVVVTVLGMILEQVCQVTNNLFLGYWSADDIHGFKQRDYMAVYAGLGAAYAVLSWISLYAMIICAIRAGFRMFNEAWYKVMHSPTSWHDRTPTGRIISRLSKDLDIKMLDDKIAQWWHQLFTNVLTIFGTFSLVLLTFPWLGLFFIPLILYFYLCGIYYRQTSREIKRLDSNLRSHVYTAFAEQLAGLAVIRAFNQQLNFQRRVQHSIDSQNRAYLLTLYTQRWLGTRLEASSDLLIFLICLFGILFRDQVNPSKFGVVLSYAMLTINTITSLIPMFAVCEQEMNNAERVQYYMDLETEAPPHLPHDPTPDQWPLQGEVRFEDVALRYRPEMPLVLKGLTFTIRPGEKIGIVGRTGAGKSSIAQALFRIVEPCGGKICIDGVDLKSVGLAVLRDRLAIIPQDAFLFSGTVRDNMDPKGVRTDAELNDALRLIQKSHGASTSLREKFQLEASVLSDGSNFSAGEKQLLALMRALVRGCKVLLLDEATSSVDPETDALIQRIIQTEFSDVTLISIAHRLQTVAFYDRILVMDAGEAAEFDTPLVLFDNPHSIFRSMCDKKSLTRGDLLRIRAEATKAAGQNGSSEGTLVEID